MHRRRRRRTTGADHCGSRLARDRVPNEVRFLDGLPHNATGKVLKHQLPRTESCPNDSMAAAKCSRRATDKAEMRPLPSARHRSNRHATQACGFRNYQRRALAQRRAPAIA
jgi:hypothetical protein